MKKEILILITASFGGGAERLVLDQMRSHDKDKFNLHVLALRKGNIEVEFQNCKEVEYLCMNAPKSSFLKTIARISRYIRKNRIKLLHAHLIESEIYTLPLKILHPTLEIVITKHGADEFRSKLAMRWFLRFISIFSAKIICVSKSRKKFAIENEVFDAGKVEFIYNGVDTEKFARIRDRNQIVALKEDLGLRRDDFVVGIIGRLIHVKGHFILIRASELLKEKIKNLKVLVLGEGELQEYLQGEVRKRGLEEIFLFSGYREDMSRIYSAIDILCIPSLREGLSTVLLEGMSTESLVIMSDLPSSKEVAFGKVEGIYFEPGNYGDLADIIDYFHKNPHEGVEIRKSARKKVIERFDYLDNLRRVEKLYLDLLPN